MIGIGTVLGVLLSTPTGRKAALIGGGLAVATPLALIGGIAGTASMDEAIAAQCLDPTAVNPAVLPAGARPAWWNVDGKGTERDKHVGIIVATVQARGLPDRAAVIATATAIQESRLINLPGGDRDSAGLFQQRPSQGWGTLAQVTDPVYATNKFLDQLEQIPGWQMTPLTQVAQAVQKSAFPDAYAQHEPVATQLVLAARPAGPETPPAPSPDGPAAIPVVYDPVNAGCAAGVVAGIPTNPGSPFKDGSTLWAFPRANPRSPQQAIAWAVQQAETGTTGWYRRCLGFTGETYGWAASGTNYALDHYRQLPAQYRHDGDRNPPPGALLFWDTGQRAGHVAVYVGGGMIATTDAPVHDKVGIVPAESIETDWRATYVGWSPPYYPNGS